MTEQDPHAHGPGPGTEGRQPTEEELRAAYEAELKRISVDDVIVQTIVSLLNLGGRRAGLAQGTEDERDLDQVRQAIEAARSLLPLVEGVLGQDARALRDALSQLQMAYAQLAGGGAQPPAREEEPPAAAEGEAPEDPARPGEPGPAQRSGRLWVPGQ
jgi:predicted NBD/HSP70 family sugar kinase